MNKKKKWLQMWIHFLKGKKSIDKIKYSKLPIIPGIEWLGHRGYADSQIIRKIMKKGNKSTQICI